MKLPLFIMCFGLILSAAAVACPHLAGDYTCSPEGSDRVDPLTVTENLANSDPSYSFNGEQIVVDNIPRSLTGDPTMRNGVFRAWCDGDRMLMEVTGEYYDGDKKIADLAMTTATQIQGDSLVQITTGETRADGTSSPISDQTVCNKSIPPGP